MSAVQVRLPPDSRHLRLSLPNKPSAKLSVTVAPNPNSTTFVVFINGLGLPQTSWWPLISMLYRQKSDTTPSIVTYDRFGQGESEPDPQDQGKEPGHGHDLASVVIDLHVLLTEVVPSEFKFDTEKLELILVGNSIGCSVARYYAQVYPGTISALLLLDATLANNDFVSILPDPDAPGYNEKQLLGNLTTEQIRSARVATGKLFLPSVPNKEGFSRRNQAEYLPLSDGPALSGPEGKAPFVTVMGHDFEVFADENLKMPGMTRDVVMLYVNPFWNAYNESLVQITEKGRGKGPVIAKGGGHFIQRDVPHLVLEQLLELLEKVTSDSA